MYLSFNKHCLMFVGVNDILMLSQSDRIMAARCRLMICEPFYGHMAINISWIAHEMPWKSVEDRTMGVRIVNGGDIQCLYYPPFVEKLSTEQLYGVIQHEIEHLLRCHCTRIDNRDHRLWNIAADMSVNGKRSSPRIGFKDNKGHLILPLDGDMIWIPEDWDSSHTTEYYYELLKEELETDCQGKLIDDHDIWSQSESSADEIRQTIKNLVEDAVDKSQGLAPNHIQSIVSSLQEPKILWRQLLRLYLGKHAGNRRLTYSRRNRMRRLFGIKGVSKHATSDINVIVDVSWSITEQELEQFFAEIEAINHKCRIWLLLWDEQFRGYQQYRRGDWKRIKINGRGGTDMAAPIEWLCDNRLIKSTQILLTDGYCEYSSHKNFDFICVITTNDVNTKYPDWGKIIVMNG